jgi:ATP-dependent DNA helicase DinG
VSHVLRENLFTQTPVIATSATLTVGKSFDPIARSLGILATADSESESEEESSIDPSNVQMLDVGSPFDFANQGMLYLPRELPEPGRDGPSKEALVELGELIDAAGGRTLALFSSWRGVEMADEHLRRVLAELPISIITQKRGDSVGSLVERFADDPTSILLGTMSLWQGVDVPGPSCTLVAIDRIPFPRPDDPVMSARAAEADAAGGSGFMQVSLPRAALLLAQGTGRLIRSVDDRGVVAILDSRIINKRYGSILLNSMPPLWRTSDGKTVKESLKRLHQQFSS